MIERALLCPDNAECFSARICSRWRNDPVGGWDRGIHRPHAPGDNATTASAQKQQYERLEKKVKPFLQEMNIPQELYDHMIRIPPDKVKILSPDDLQRYGLNENDPYEDAATTAIVAKSLGISSEEAIRRMAKVKAECSSEDPDCVTRILKQGR